MFKKIDYSNAVRNDVFHNKLQKRIVAVLPAHNESDSIGNTLDSLRNLVVPEGLEFDLFVALDNCTDDTENVLESNSDYVICNHCVGCICVIRNKISFMARHSDVS